ncbi:MAG: 4a-hydroxytetrahydrobiopterin dehydratase [Candidatus Kapaibacterium sp.]
MTTQLLSPEELAIQLPAGWHYNNAERAIVKEYNKGNFSGAISFINKIASFAEAQDHHPDLFLHKYSKVRVILSSHSAGGVTGNDLKLAKIIDAI